MSAHGEQTGALILMVQLLLAPYDASHIWLTWLSFQEINLYTKLYDGTCPSLGPSQFLEGPLQYKAF